MATVDEEEHAVLDRLTFDYHQKLQGKPQSHELVRAHTLPGPSWGLSWGGWGMLLSVQLPPGSRHCSLGLVTAWDGALVPCLDQEPRWQGREVPLQRVLVRPRVPTSHTGAIPPLSPSKTLTQYRRSSLALPYLGSSAGLTTKDQGEENFSKSLSKSEA